MPPQIEQRMRKQQVLGAGEKEDWTSLTFVLVLSHVEDSRRSHHWNFNDFERDDLSK